MNKNDKEYFAIFDEYLEKVPDKEDCYYITDNTLVHFIYEMTLLERQKSKAENSLYRLRREVKHYKTLTHTYKVEMNRCVRKLTRIYDKIRRYAMMNYVYNVGAPKPDEVVKLFKEM